jgi:hypothetical protein
VVGCTQTGWRMVVMDIEEDMNVETKVVDSGNWDEQEHPPIHDKWEKNHQIRPTPH